MRTILTLFATLILVTGCIPKDWCSSEDGCNSGWCSSKESEYLTRCDYNPDGELLSEVIITFSRELKDSRSLFLYNSRAIFDGGIKKVRIDYTSMRSVELCEAREILVDVVEGLIDRIRNHVELRSAFNHHPITAEDFQIHITFDSYFNKYVDPSYTAYIILEDGWSFFYNSELNMAFTDIWMQKVEPYYKTKQFVTFSREAEERHKLANEEEPKKSALEQERYIWGTSTNTFSDN